jgi:hypothetical protein
MQRLLASLGLPADPLISSLKLQRRGAEPQAPEPALFRANQVAHLGAHQRTRPSGRLLDHQLVPDTPLGITLYPDQLKFLSLPIHFPYRWQIIDLTFGVTLFMLLFNGTSVGWLMRRLGVDEPSVSDQYLSSLVAAEAQREALARVEHHPPMATVDEGVLTAVRSAYSVKLENINARAQALRSRLAESREERCRLLWLQTLAVQRKIYHARHDEGLLCLKSLNALEWALHQTDTDFKWNVSTVVAEQTLPTDRGMEAEVLSILARIFPRLPLLGRWQFEREVSLYELAAALVAASRGVLEELENPTKLSGADVADVANCRRYYHNLQSMAVVRLDMMEHRFTTDINAVEVRVLQRLAIDGERDVLHRLSASGSVLKK